MTNEPAALPAVASAYPEWKPELAKDYDERMRKVCAEIEGVLRADSDARQSLLSDPRGAHARLYAGLTPPGFAAYAGTYRGTSGTALEHRNVGAPSFTGLSDSLPFIGPGQVAQMMEGYAKLVDLAPSRRGLSREERIEYVARVFLVFGATHPFLNGNGHVQRLIFLALSLEVALSVLPHWTIHPRPFAEEGAVLLEKFRLKQIDVKPVAAFLGGFVGP